jgi:hypothetical protein
MKTNAPPRRFRQWWLAAGAALVMAGLVGAWDYSLGRRLAVPRQARYVPEYDVLLARPNLDVTVQTQVYTKHPAGTAAFRYRVRTDAHGRRVGEKVTEPAGRPGLVLLGDSFSFGCHAEYEDTLPGQLERLLPGQAVVNCSASGSCSDCYAPTLRYFMEHAGVKPDFLLVGLYPCMQVGDLPRVVAREKFGSYKEVAYVPVQPSRYREIQASTLGFARFRAELFLRETSSLFNTLVPPRPAGEFAVSLKDRMDAEHLKEYHALLRERVGRIQRAAGLPPSRIAFWLVPSHHDALFHHKPAGYNEADTRFFRQSALFWDQVQRWLREQGYQAIDTQPAVMPLLTHEGAFPFTVDCHLSAPGYRAVAEQIARALAGLLVHGG